MNKLLTYIADLYSFFKGLTTKCKDCTEEKILIAEGGHVGDILMDASALYAIIIHFQQLGKKVYFLCSHPLWDIMSICYDMQSVVYIGAGYSYDFLRYEDVSYVSKQLENNTFECIIGIHNADRRICSLIARIKAKVKWGVIQKESNGIKSKIKRFFAHHCYTGIIWGDKNQFQLHYLCELLKKLNIEDYKAQTAYIPSCNKVSTPLTPYIVVALDSANSIRRWPTHNYISLIRQLLNEYGMSVYLMGKKLSEDSLAMFDNAFKSDGERVVNLIGKTNVTEWIEFIRNSRFVIGVDSGSIHVSAAVGTPSFCLTGVWDGHKCMPYDVEIVTEGTALPICIYRQDTDVNDLPCYDCGYHGGYGCGNAECLTQCKAGQPCLCLSKITPDDVMAAIHHAQETGAIEKMSLQNKFQSRN